MAKSTKKSTKKAAPEVKEAEEPGIMLIPLERYKLEYLKLDTLDVLGNVRDDTNVENLAVDISANGLRTALVVTSAKKGYTVLAGHRRTKALRTIPNLSEICPEGVPCLVVEDLTDTERDWLIADHGNQQGLASTEDVYTSAVALLKTGMSEGRVANALYGSIATLTGAKGKGHVEIAGIKKELKAATTVDYKLSLTASLQLKVSQTLRGTLQNYNNIRRLPDTVEVEMVKIWNKATGAKNITNADVTALYKEHIKDLAVHDKDGMPVYSKSKPGPSFSAAWKKLVNKKPGEKKVDTEKVKTKKEMENDLTGGDFKSALSLALLSYCMGKPGIERDHILALDARALETQEV